MEKYWIAVLVVAALALSSVDGAALTASGEERHGLILRFLPGLFCSLISSHSPSPPSSPRKYVRERYDCFELTHFSCIQTYTVVYHGHSATTSHAYPDIFYTDIASAEQYDNCCSRGVEYCFYICDNCAFRCKWYI